MGVFEDFERQLHLSEERRLRAAGWEPVEYGPPGVELWRNGRRSLSRAEALAEVDGRARGDYGKRKRGVR